MITDAKLARSYRLLMWGALIVLAAALAACEFPVRDCDPADMPAPVSLIPDNGPLVDSLTPTLTWEYWGECDPDVFALRITDVSTDTTWSGEVDGTTWRWTSPVTLRPATHYWWSVTPYSGSTGGSISGGSFRTGPLCAGVRASDYVAPVLVRPADGTVLDEAYYHYLEGQPPLIVADMVWENPAGCLPPDGYRMQVARSPSFPPGPDTWDGWGSLGNTARFFLPPGVDYSSCEPWYWRVAPILPEASLGPFSETWTFYVNTAGLVCPPELRLITPIVPAIPPGALPMPDTPSGTPFARVIQDANCRSGPGIVYPLLTFVSQGQSFPIQGRNADSTWWWIDRPDGDCWLADSVVETEGNTGSVPEQQAPPTPTVTPELGCWQQLSPNLPNRCVVPCPADVQNPTYCTP